MNEQHVRIINQRLQEGYAPRDILAEVPVSRRLISYYAKRLGFRFKAGRPPGRMPHSISRQSEARRLKASGWTYKRIANKFRVRYQWVQFLLKIPKHQLAKRCDDCGGNYRLCGHHLDYLSDRFRTLCARCHRMAHCKQLALTTIMVALKQHRWNKTKTASQLGISRPALDAWIAKYKLKPKTR